MTRTLASALRRGFGACALATLMATASMTLGATTASWAQTPAAEAQKIADHFSRVRSMSGEFVQFGPKGEQTGGKFFIERPGKIIFNYDPAVGVKVISDGRSVAINNEKLRTWDVYPLSKTPLKLLLDDRIDLAGNQVRSVKQDADITTIELANRSLFGNSTIAMMFDPKSYELRQWTITDAQGKDTTVMIFNVQEGVSFKAGTFKIDYEKIQNQASYGAPKR